MTAQREPEHCLHECVCLGVQVASDFKCPLDTGLWKECKHDTRSRPLPAPAPERDQYRKGWNDILDTLDGWQNKRLVCLSGDCCRTLLREKIAELRKVNNH